MKKSDKLPGKEILRIRKMLGMTQEDMAKAMDVAVTTVQNWEHDRTTICGPVRRILENLAEQFYRSEAKRYGVDVAIIRAGNGRPGGIQQAKDKVQAEDTGAAPGIPPGNAG